VATGDYPLFVYGTLRSESDHEFARLLRGASDFVSVGRVRGSLYRIAQYPGWVEEESLGGPLPYGRGSEAGSVHFEGSVIQSRDRKGPDRWVTGEIWKPHEPASLLATLDRYEGPEYNRVVRSVDTPQGPADCWAYLYVASIQGKERIISGNWLA